MLRSLRHLACSFTSYRSFTSEAKTKLLQNLNEQLLLSKARYEFDDEVAPFLTNSGFTLIENQKSKMMITKQIKDKEVQITFEQRRPSEEERKLLDASEEDKLKQEEEDNKIIEEFESQKKLMESRLTENGKEALDYENFEVDKIQQVELGEEYHDNYAVFQVLIKKINSNEGIIFECISQNGIVHPINILWTKDIENTERQTTSKLKNYYRGRAYITLKEKIQDLFKEHLERYGVDERVGVFIEFYSLDKHLRLNIEWLEKLNDFYKD